MTPVADTLPHRAVWLIASVYLILAAVLFYLLAIVWPVGTANQPLRLIALVIITSALGSYIHTVTSFATYAGNRALSTDWLAWYLLRPAISAALALIFYFTLRAGLFTGSAPDQAVNPFGIAALSGMVGLFSKQATAKLSKVFDTLFS